MSMPESQARELKWIAVSYGIIAAVWLCIAIFVVHAAEWRIANRTFISALGGTMLMLLLAFVVSAGLAFGAWRFQTLSQRWRAAVLSIAVIVAAVFVADVARAGWLLLQGRQLALPGMPREMSLSAMSGNILLTIGLVMNAIQLVRAYALLRIERP